MTAPLTGPLTGGELDDALEHEILGAPMAHGQRHLGIEVEYLILHRETRASAPLSFCRQLLEALVNDLDGIAGKDGDVLNLVDGDMFFLTMEPGGQLEIATDPLHSLQEIDPVMVRVTNVVRSRLGTTDYDLASIGHAPVTKVADLGLLPRERYRIMDAVMPKRGPLTRNMMRATAGLQATYDIEDRADAGRKLALLYRLSPVLLAITANSRLVEGRDSGYASFRHKVWWETDRDRSGVPEGCLHGETAVDGYIRYARQATMLFFERDGRLVRSPERSLEQLVADGQVTRRDLALHLSSLFPLIRLRNYLEVRCLDAVDWPLARGMVALMSGVIYCATATAKAEELSACL
ncbi:MAG: glutamate-cysteine ligase family protein, partial [Planctomycetota bacterium]